MSSLSPPLRSLLLSTRMVITKDQITPHPSKAPPSCSLQLDAKINPWTATVGHLCLAFIFQMLYPFNTSDPYPEGGSCLYRQGREVHRTAQHVTMRYIVVQYRIALSALAAFCVPSLHLRVSPSIGYSNSFGERHLFLQQAVRKV